MIDSITDINGTMKGNNSHLTNFCKLDVLSVRNIETIKGVLTVKYM